MKSNRVTTNNQLTRRNFLGLAGAVLIGGVYVPEAYAKERKVEESAPNAQAPQDPNQPYVIPAYLAITPAEFPITANLYPGAISPGTPYTNPRVASMSELFKATPAYREAKSGKYGLAKADLILAQAPKELCSELFQYCAANAIGFVGDREAYLNLVYSKPEWNSAPQATRNEDLNKVLALYDITPAMDGALRERKYQGSASMGNQISEKEINGLFK